MSNGLYNGLENGLENGLYESQEDFVFCIELQKIIKRAKMLNYTIPSLSTLFACNDLIITYKEIGYWNKCDVILNFAYNNLSLFNFARINWVDPNGSLASYNGTRVYTLNGIEGNGANFYVDTNFNLATQARYYRQNDAHKLFIMGNTGGAFETIDGIFVNNFNFLRTSLARFNSGSSSLTISPSISGNGLKALIRTSISAVEIINLATSTPGTLNANSVSSANQVILAGNNGNYATSNHKIRNASYGSSITYSQTQLIRTAINKYFTKIGLTQVA